MSHGEPMTRRNALKKGGLILLGLALAKSLYGSNDVTLKGPEYTDLLEQIYAKVRPSFSTYIFGLEMKTPLSFDINGDNNPDKIEFKQREMGLDTPILLMGMNLSGKGFVDFRSEVKNGKFKEITVSNATAEEALKYLNALKENLYK
ncbi:MAG: hypothetical protein NTU57_02010 [Candidatus Aenigmarchaeota archaeon]|nr:hypothetical protein [Candidatus Aenigmarchaeota archaeon]